MSESLLSECSRECAIVGDNYGDKSKLSRAMERGEMATVGWNDDDSVWVFKN